VLSFRPLPPRPPPPLPQARVLGLKPHPLLGKPRGLRGLSLGGGLILLQARDLVRVQPGPFHRRPISSLIRAFSSASSCFCLACNSSAGLDRAQARRCEHRGHPEQPGGVLAAVRGAPPHRRHQGAGQRRSPRAGRISG
jgi:hypothetical protein